MMSLQAELAVSTLAPGRSWVIVNLSFWAKEPIWKNKKKTPKQSPQNHKENYMDVSAKSYSHWSISGNFQEDHDFKPGISYYIFFVQNWSTVMSKDKRVNLSLLSSTKNTSSKTMQSSLSPLTRREQEDLFLLTWTVTYVNVVMRRQTPFWSSRLLIFPQLSPSKCNSIAKRYLLPVTIFILQAS